MTTLSQWVLDEIKDNWDGVFPTSGLERVAREDTDLLEANRQERRGELQKHNIVMAHYGGEAQVRLHAEGGDVVSPIVTVRIEGLDIDKHGHVEDHADFRELVDDVKAAIREVRSPDVGDAHPGSFDEVRITDERSFSHLLADHYVTELDLTFTGTRS